MKNAIKNTTKWMVALLAITLSLNGCNSKKSDSKDAAEEQNDNKFEETTKVKDDTEFAVEAADGGMLEVRLAELAQTKATAPEVKQLAQMMIKDHGKANEELKSLAAKKNISLPATLGNENKRHYDDLAAKTGKDFDDAYTDLMVKDHEEDLDEFKKEADKGNDPEIKSWAAGKVAVLEHHLEMAKQAEDAVGKNK